MRPVFEYRSKRATKRSQARQPGARDCGSSDEPAKRVEDTVVVQQTGDVAFSSQTFEDTGDALGTEIQRSDDSPLHVTHQVQCHVSLAAVDDRHVLAHELGDALGLEQVDDDSNLMCSHPPNGDELSDEQRGPSSGNAAWRSLHASRERAHARGEMVPPAPATELAGDSLRCISRRILQARCISRQPPRPRARPSPCDDR